MLDTPLSRCDAVSVEKGSVKMSSKPPRDQDTMMNRSEKNGKGTERSQDRRSQDRPNRVKRFRERRLMSKAELARKAGLSALTIDRVESGKSCRMDTKRKIVLALGLKLEDAQEVFDTGGDNEE